MNARKNKAILVKAPHQSAEQAIGTLTPGCRVIGLTKGQFSLLDILKAVLAQTGPARVIVSTWTTGIRDAENARMLLERGAITNFTLLTDRSFATRQSRYAASVMSIFGPNSIRATNTHAKFVLVRNERWNIAVRSSMNLNRNPRFEQFDLDDDSEIADFLEEHAHEMEDLMPPGVRPPSQSVSSGFTRAMGGTVSKSYGHGKDDTVDMDALLGLTSVDIPPAEFKSLTLPGIS